MNKIITLFFIICFSSTALAKSFSFYVEMACGNCSAAIEKSMKKLYDGQYTDFHADFDRDVVTLKSEKLTEKNIIDAISKAGFTVSQTPINNKASAPK